MPRKTRDHTPKPANQPLKQYSEEILIWVAHYFFEGKTPSDIVRMLKEHHNIEMGIREIHKSILPQIMRRKWACLISPLDNSLTEKFKQSSFGLDEVRVTPLRNTDDVATHAAYMIRSLIAEIAKKKETVHIGFSGGITTRRVFQKLVDCLNEVNFVLLEDKTLVWHALVAGFDNDAPGTEPSAFFTYLDDCKTTFKNKFVQFHAPALVPGKQMEDILKLPAIQEAREKAARLDLIVSSAATFSDRHSQLKLYYEKHLPKTNADMDRLHKAGCVGDMLWLPVGSGGPIDLTSFDHRPVTLLELEHLPSRIDEGTKVLLIVGPCAADPSDLCKKTPILQAILNLQRNKKVNRHITHLVVDKGTAQQFLDGLPELDVVSASITAAGKSN